MPRTSTAPKFRIRPVGVDLIRESAQQLLTEHWDEIALNKRVMVLDPIWTSYYELEERDALLALGLFLKDGDKETLVGYSVNFLMQHIHYGKLRFCQNDVLFVAKAHRGRGRRLIAATEAAAKENGCQMIVWHAKQGTALERILPKAGYGVQDILFSKEL